MRYKGTITNWIDKKGFGFITPSGGGNQVFVHITSFARRKRRPIGNEIVTYELGTDTKGRRRAMSVLFSGESLPSTYSPAYNFGLLMLAAAFLFFISATTLAGMLPLAVLWIYLIASSITFFAYAFDKLAARNDRRRTPENTLHLFALLGGWPGALAAQRLFHHKSKKPSFQILFWMTVILNCGVLGWLFSEAGARMLRSIFDSLQWL